MQSDVAPKREHDVEEPVIGPGHSYGSVTDKISSIVLTRKTPKGWFIGFGIAITLLSVLLYSIIYLLTEGVGIWVLRASSKEEAAELLKTHPWVEAGLRDVSEIYQWNVQQALGIGRFELQTPQQ